MNRITLFSVLTITLLLGATSSILVQPGNAAPAWWNENWKRRIPLTINSVACMDEYLENFPVLVRILSGSTAGDELRDNARDDGYDIAFTDSDWQQFDHEIEFFDGSTGTLYAWVRIPSLPTSTITTIYMYYDNSGASNQENPNDVWNSNYKMVQHLSETAGTHYDSTSNNNDGTPSGGVSQDVAGQLDGGDQFDGTDDYIDLGTSSSLSITDQITFEAWIKPDSITPSEDWNLLIRSYLCYGTYIPYQFYLANLTANVGFWSTAGGVDSGVPVDGSWQHIAVTVEDSSSTVNFYINGVNVATKTGNFGPDFAGAKTELAAFCNGGSAHFDGFMDEVRLSNVVRDGCWIKTSYENQNDPSGFVTAGTAEQISNFQLDITIEARDISSTLLDSGMIEVDDTPTTANQQTYTWIKGSSHKLEALSPKTAFGDRYYWKKWGDGGSQTHYYTVPESGGGNVTAYFAKQYYLTVDSKYDDPQGEGWYDEGDTASFSVTSPIIFSNATKATCTNVSLSGTQIMDQNYTFTFTWITESLNRTITVDTDKHVAGKEVKVDGVEYDTPRTFIWVNASTHYLEALSPLAGIIGVRYVWDNWDDAGAQNHTYTTPNSDATVTASYNTQFFLTVNSEFDDPQGEGWYDELYPAIPFNVTSPVEVNGTRYICTGFEGDVSGSGTMGVIYSIDSPKAVTFLWDATDYYLTVNSEYGTTHGEGWYKPGDTPEFYVTPEFIEEDGVRHVFQGWTGDYIDGANPAGAKQILMDGPKTVTAVWRDRFFIEIISPYGSPKGSSWPFKGENFEVGVISPDSGYVVTGFKLDGGSLQPGAKYMFVNVQEPHKIEFFWGVLTETTIYTLTLNTNPPNKGTIAVGVTVYEHGESLTTIPGIYTIQASPDDDYQFVRWQTSGGATVSNSGSSTTSITLGGDGTLTMIQQKLGVAPPPGVWGGPETQFQCIIATAAYGSPMDPEVAYMRNVRDNMIGSTPIGKTLVTGFNTFYYSWSPPVAQWIADSEGLRTTFRVLLLPISAAVHSAEIVYTTVSPFSQTTASVTAFLLAAAISIGTYIITPIFAGLTIYRKKYAS
jgi:hypothetical protein